MGCSRRQVLFLPYAFDNLLGAHGSALQAVILLVVGRDDVLPSAANQQHKRFLKLSRQWRTNTGEHKFRPDSRERIGHSGHQLLKGGEAGRSRPGRPGEAGRNGVAAGRRASSSQTQTRIARDPLHHVNCESLGQTLATSVVPRLGPLRCRAGIRWLSRASLFVCWSDLATLCFAR
jgi:hypothetical protein